MTPDAIGRAAPVGGVTDPAGASTTGPGRRLSSRRPAHEIAEAVTTATPNSTTT
jgi:hypothetical protein